MELVLKWGLASCPTQWETGQGEGNYLKQHKGRLVQVGYQEKFLHWKSVGALEQALQWTGEVTIPGDKKISRSGTLWHGLEGMVFMQRRDLVLEVISNLTDSVMLCFQPNALACPLNSSLVLKHLLLPVWWHLQTCWERTPSYQLIITEVVDSVGPQNYPWGTSLFAHHQLDFLLHITGLWTSLSSQLSIHLIVCLSISHQCGDKEVKVVKTKYSLKIK